MTYCLYFIMQKQNYKDTLYANAFTTLMPVYVWRFSIRRALRKVTRFGLPRIKARSIVSDEYQHVWSAAAKTNTFDCFATKNSTFRSVAAKTSTLYCFATKNSTFGNLRRKLTYFPVQMVSRESCALWCRGRNEILIFS